MGSGGYKAIQTCIRRHEMKKRFLEAVGVAAVIVAVVVLLKLTQAPLTGQAPAAATPAGAVSTAGPAPKTQWNEPDLQGLWTYDVEVPLQRSARFGNREFFTPEEQAALDTARVRILSQSDRIYSPGSARACGGADNQTISSTLLHTGL